MEFLPDMEGIGRVQFVLFVVSAGEFHSYNVRRHKRVYGGMYPVLSL